MFFPILAVLCKYQQRASCLLCCSKASATSLTFIYICCQRITFLSYERLSRPACLNVVTHRFIIRSLGTKLKGPICDSNINNGAAPSPTTFKRQNLLSPPNRLDNNMYVVKGSVHTKSQYTFTLMAGGNFGTK